jgi:hypothetical protein
VCIVLVKNEEMPQNVAAIASIGILMLQLVGGVHGPEVLVGIKSYMEN